MKSSRFWVVLVIVFVLMFGAVWGITVLITKSVVSPGDVVFNRISTFGADWIELYNRTGHALDLSGCILSDGKNRYALPERTFIQAKDKLVMVQEEDRKKAESAGIRADLTWRGFGFGHAKSEFALLLNRAGNVIIDFVQTIPLQEHEILARVSPDSEKWEIEKNGQKQQEVHLNAASNVDITPAEQRTLNALQFVKQSSKEIAGILSVVVTIGGLIGKLVGTPGPKPRTVRAAERAA